MDANSGEAEVRLRGVGPQHFLALSGLLGVILAGCDGSAKKVSPNSSTAVATAAPTSSEDSRYVAPLLKDWEKPTLALMLSGELHGYLEPCGCSLTQSGGLERRGDLQQQLQEKGWLVVGLDAGGVLKRTRRQDRLKFEAILNGLKTLGYRAVGTGDSELRLPPDYLIGQFSEGTGIPLGGMLLACNVILFDSPDLGVPKSSTFVDVAGETIAVTSVVGHSVAKDALPPGAEGQVRVTPAAEALKTLLATPEWQAAKLRVLLAHSSLDEGRQLAKAFPEFQVVVTAGGPEDPGDQPERYGSTLLVQTGHKGKYVGVLGYYAGEADPFRWELVNLDNVRFHGDKRMHQVMANYQQLVQDQSLATSDELQVPDPPGRSFVGAARCGECHTKAYAKWKGTKHAHALESLAKGRKGQEADWISRIYDPECLACHVTGWDAQNVLRYASGYTGEETTPHLVGQQCENCHSAGSQHSSLEQSFRKDLKSVSRDELMAARRDMKLNAATAEQQVCAKCHDAENSPNFKFAKYWDEVKHPWKD